MGIIDKAAYEARALIKEGIPIVLCEFHVIKAMLEHWDTKLRLRNSHTLFVLLLSAKFVKRGRTEAQVNARWRVARDQVYLALDFANVDGINKRAEAIAYFEAEWICERWRRWCWGRSFKKSIPPGLLATAPQPAGPRPTDAGRFRHDLRTPL